MPVALQISFLGTIYMNKKRETLQQHLICSLTLGVCVQ